MRPAMKLPDHPYSTLTRDKETTMQDLKERVEEMAYALEEVLQDPMFNTLATRTVALVELALGVCNHIDRLNDDCSLCFGRGKS